MIIQREDAGLLAVPAELKAAALMLKGAALYQLSDAPAARASLEQSVNLAPLWIANRQLLATIYERQKDLRAAEEELSYAIANTNQQAPTESVPHRLFEWLITGRGAHGITSRLQDHLARVHNAR